MSVKITANYSRYSSEDIEEMAHALLRGDECQRVELVVRNAKASSPFARLVHDRHTLKYWLFLRQPESTEMLVAMSLSPGAALPHEYGARIAAALWELRAFRYDKTDFSARFEKTAPIHILAVPPDATPRRSAAEVFEERKQEFKGCQERLREASQRMFSGWRHDVPRLYRELRKLGRYLEKRGVIAPVPPLEQLIREFADAMVKDALDSLAKEEP